MYNHPRLPTASNGSPLTSPSQPPTHFLNIRVESRSTHFSLTSHPPAPTAFCLLPPPISSDHFSPTSPNHFPLTPISRPLTPTAAPHAVPSATPARFLQLPLALFLQLFLQLPSTHQSSAARQLLSHSFLTHYLLFYSAAVSQPLQAHQPSGQAIDTSHFYFSILHSRRFQSLHFRRHCHRDVQQTRRYFLLSFRFLVLHTPL